VTEEDVVEIVVHEVSNGSNEHPAGRARIATAKVTFEEGDPRYAPLETYPDEVTLAEPDENDEAVWAEDNVPQLSRRLEADPNKMNGRML
jgi:hypothetical protein